MRKIIQENVIKINDKNEDELVRYFVNLVYREDGITLAEALTITIWELGTKRMEAVLAYFKSKAEGFIRVQIDRELEPRLWLTVKGLKWIHGNWLQVNTQSSLEGEIVE